MPNIHIETFLRRFISTSVRLIKTDDNIVYNLIKVGLTIALLLLS